MPISNGTTSSMLDHIATSSFALRIGHGLSSGSYAGYQTGWDGGYLLTLRCNRLLDWLRFFPNLGSGVTCLLGCGVDAVR